MKVFRRHIFHYPTLLFLVALLPGCSTTAHLPDGEQLYLGTTGNMIYQMGSGALRGMGDSTWPFLFLLMCSVLNIVLDLVLTGEEVYVHADKSKIQQIIYNLTDNAIKFSHHDSSIRIETHVKNEKVFVAVKDSGIGIPKESLGKIWERFYKTDLSRGKDKKGTGIGLAIVKEIIQAHGENINVISTEGVGTEFIFTLQFVDDAE